MRNATNPAHSGPEGTAPSWLWDAERLRILWANDAGLAFFGAELLFDLLDHPFDAAEPGPKRIREIKAGLEPGKSVTAELEFPSAGENRRFHAALSLKALADGRMGVLVTATDPRAELENSGPAMAFAALPQPVLITDGLGRILNRNEAARAMVTAASLGEMIGNLTAADLYGRLAAAGTVSGVHRIATPFGERDIRLTLRKLSPDSAESAVVMLEDITERRRLERELSGLPARKTEPEAETRPKLTEAEHKAFVELGKLLQPAAAAQKPEFKLEPKPETKPEPAEAPRPQMELAAILDTVSDGILTLDAEGRIESFSGGAEAMFGLRRADVLGRGFGELFAPEARKTVKDYLSALSDQGLASVFNDGREVTALAEPEGTIPVFLTLSRLGDGFCAVLRDITQWKKTEAELRVAKDNAETASRQKSEFLARISHELRTPLNAILGFSEIMRMERFGDIGNDRYRGYVNDIHASGTHLLSLINDLLDLSKVEAGKMELAFTNVSIAIVAEAAMKLVAGQAQANRVILRSSIPANLPQVVADHRAMQQILLNLLSNAVKFTEPGGQVILSASLTAAGELAIRVKDSGPGMDAAELKEALEPFRRVARDRPGAGTGLGLPLTKALAEANRARFAISSEPGKGTLAEITFPTTRVLAD